MLVPHHTANRRRRRRSPTDAETRSYATVLQQDYGAREIFPLVDVASGTAATVFIGNGDNGEFRQGYTLQDAAGPVSGSLAPAFDGSDGCINLKIGSNGLLIGAIAGSILLWAKASGASVWTGTDRHFLYHFYDDNSNYLRIQKANIENTLRYEYSSGGTSKSVEHTTSTLGWFSVGLTWDHNAGADGELKAYFNGAQVGTTQTGLSAYTGDRSFTVMALAAQHTGGLYSWPGWLAYLAFRLGAWTPTEIAAMHAAAATAQAD